MELSAKPGGLPNFFYDVIVFLIPTLLFAIGISLGMGWESYVIQYATSGKLEGWHTLWIIIVMLLASYEYGRLAETFSDTLVGIPLRYLHRKKCLLKSKDFTRDLCDQVTQLKLVAGAIAPRLGSKWTVYMFALVFTPALGADLIKRYAWEKLARSSAFSCALLAIISLCVAFGKAFLDKMPITVDERFGSLSYTLTALLSYVALSCDYYKRNAWNHDLLVTVIPVLARAAEARVTTSENGDEK